MRGIRLTDSQVLDICTAFRSCFLGGDSLWLFGSRTNINQRWGDIDLYIETAMENPEEIVKSRLSFLNKLEKALGEQKIDVVIKSNNFDLDI